MLLRLSIPFMVKLMWGSKLAVNGPRDGIITSTDVVETVVSTFYGPLGIVLY